jgi:hypothetical protein
MKQYQLNHNCKLCGFIRGKHQARTYNCPINGRAFTHFLPQQVFEPSDKAPPKPNFTI